MVRWGLLVPLLCLALPTQAAETLPLALAATWRDNPTLQAARAATAAAEARLDKAAGERRPAVTASADAGVARVDGDSGADSLLPASVELSAVQPLYRGGAIAAGISAAEADWQALAAAEHSAGQFVLLLGAGAYLDLLRDQSIESLRANNVLVLQRQLQATRDRFEVGDVTRTDVSQSEARLARAEADLRLAQGTLLASRATYEEVIGHAPESLSPLDSAAHLGALLPATLNEATSRASVDHPDVQQARYAAAAAADRMAVAEGALWPSVDLRATGGSSWDQTASQRQRSDDARLLAELRIPLYNAGKDHAAIRENARLRQQAQFNLTAEERSTRQRAISAWEQLASASSALAARQSQVGAAGIALDGVRLEAEAGTRTVLDVLDAEQELLDAQVALVGAERDRALAAFTLLAAVGGLNAEALQLPAATDLSTPMP